MSILGMLLVLAVIGFCLYLVLTYIPMPEPVRKVIIVVVVIFLIIWVLNTVGLLAPLNQPLRVR